MAKQMLRETAKEQTKEQGQIRTRPLEEIRNITEPQVRTRLTAAFNTAWGAAVQDLVSSWQRYFDDERRSGGDARAQDIIDNELPNFLTIDGRGRISAAPELQQTRDQARTAFVEQSTRAVMAGLSGRASSSPPIRLGMGEEFAVFLSTRLVEQVGIAIPTGVDPTADIRHMPETHRVEFARATIPPEHLPLAIRPQGEHLHFGWPNWIGVAPSTVEVSRLDAVPRTRGAKPSRRATAPRRERAEREPRRREPRRSERA